MRSASAFCALISANTAAKCRGLRSSSNTAASDSQAWKVLPSARRIGTSPRQWPLYAALAHSEALCSSGSSGATSESSGWPTMLLASWPVSRQPAGLMAITRWRVSISTTPSLLQSNTLAASSRLCAWAVRRRDSGRMASRVAAPPPMVSRRMPSSGQSRLWRAPAYSRSRSASRPTAQSGCSASGATKASWRCPGPAGWALSVDCVPRASSSSARSGQSAGASLRPAVSRCTCITRPLARWMR
ncbi:hypothetical protein D3C81_1478130 [compost metagenome]